MFPRELEIRLRRRQVIPFVGAGVSQSVRQADGTPLFPGWADLLLRAAERLKEEGKPFDAQTVEGNVRKTKPSFLEAAKAAQDGLGPLWAAFLKAELGPSFEKADPKSLALPGAIWALGSPLVVTTNYDSVLQWACPEAAAKDLEFWDIEAKVEHGHLLQSGLTQHPTVWHLHGRIGNAAELILTFDDYRRLYGSPNAQSRYLAALATFRTLVATRSLLFIGISFTDDATIDQLQEVRALFANTPGPHYALLRESDARRVQSLDLGMEVITIADFGDLLPKVLQLGKIASEGAPSPASSPSPSPAATPPAAAYSTDNCPFFVPFGTKGDKVIGAEGPLRRVREQLTQKGPTSIGQTAAFQGLGGLGKTQLAVEYAWRYRDQYPNGVIWLTADQDIASQLTRLAVEAKWVPDATDHKLKLEVAQHRIRSFSDCLVVFDNVEDLAMIQPYLPLRDAHPHLLLTSRTEQPGFVPIPLDLLNVDQSLELLTSEAGRPPMGADEQQAAAEIAEDLGGLPLALEMAGAYLLYRQVQWQQYRDLLKVDTRAALRGKHLASFTRHEDDLYATLRIQEEIYEDEPLLRGLLDVLTWSGSAPIGVSLLAALLAVEETALLDAVSLGIQLRLLERSADVQKYSLHRLVRKVRQDDEPLGERPEWVEEICQRLGDWFATRRLEFTNLATFETEIDHLYSWQQQALSLSNSQVSRLTWLLAYPPYHRGQYKLAHRWLARAQESLGRDDLESELGAWIWSDLGAINLSERYNSEALECHRRALAIRRDVLSLNHQDSARSLAGIGAACRSLGDLAGALDYATQAYTIRLKVLGKETDDTASSLVDLASIFHQRREWDKALEYEFEALTIRRKVFGQEHPAIASTLSSIVVTLQKRGHRDDLQVALDYSNEALTIRRKMYGDEHPDTAGALNNLANLQYLSGYTEQALTSFSTATEIFGRFLGGDHWLTINAAIGMANLLRASNRPEESFRVLAHYGTNPPIDPDQARQIKYLLQQLTAKPLRPGFRTPKGTKGKKTRR